MTISLVAKRYAKALFDLAVENNLVEEVRNDNLLIASTCKSNRDLRLLLKSPIINTDKKRIILKEIFSASVQKLTMAYILIMVRKNRESFIPEIAQDYDDLYLTYKGILKVHFSAPVTPDEATRKQVLKIMENYTKATVLMTSEVDESLIGGFVLTWKDKQFDASIRREIEDIRAQVARVNLYKKGF